MKTNNIKSSQSIAESETNAFFSLHRKYLYLAALIIITNFALLFIAVLYLIENDMGNWVFALIPFNLLVYNSILIRSPEGRGCLREAGLGYMLWKLAPKTQVKVSLVFTIIGILLALIKYL